MIKFKKAELLATLTTLKNAVRNSTGCGLVTFTPSGVSSVELSAVNFDFCIGVVLDSGRAGSFDSFEIDFKTLLACVKSESSDWVTIDPAGSVSGVTVPVTHDKAMPLMAVGPVSSTLTSSAGVMSDALGVVMPAAADRDIRYYLNGALLSAIDNQLAVVTTDGHRLHKIQTGAPMIAPDCIIPRDSCVALASILKKRKTPLKLSFNEKGITAAIDNVVLKSKLLDGRFPDYGRIVPGARSNYLEVSTNQAAEIVAILKASKPFTNKKFQAVKLAIRPDSLVVSASDGLGLEFERAHSITYTGAPLIMGFNVDYLIDALTCASLSHSSIRLEFATDRDSVKITAGHFLAVIMPCRL